MANDLHEFITDHALTNPVVVGHSMGGEHLTRVLDAVCSLRGKPQVIRTDNGPEFRGIFDKFLEDNETEGMFPEPLHLPKQTMETVSPYFGMQ